MAGKIKKSGQGDSMPDMKSAPEIFVDGFQGIMIRNNIVKINFYSKRMHSGRSEEKKGALIMSLSLPDLVAITDGLNKFIGSLEEEGMLIKVETGGE